jgi:basic amino acid/polyamine antiporter, APA family
VFFNRKLDNLVQILIPPVVSVLFFLIIFELFFDVGKYFIIIDIFDIFVVSLFIIDLYFRWKENPNIVYFIKNYHIDIIASLPLNFIFFGFNYLFITRTSRDLEVMSRVLKFNRLLRLGRFFIRLLRVFSLRSFVKKAKIKKTLKYEKKLTKVFGYKSILLVTINSIMGTGIWFLTATGVKYAGPASLISWAILSIIAIYIAMCFSELTSMFPKAGGVYEFAKQSYGRFGSFVVGWLTSICGSVTISMLLLGALQYAIPLQYSNFYIPIAILLLFIFNFVAYKGMKTSMIVLVCFALLTIITIVSSIIPGFFSFSLNNLSPFFVFPAINILLAIFFIAETFFGWESTIFLASETKNPEKVMPKALIVGTIIISIFALLLTVVAMGSIPWQDYSYSVAPLRDLGNAYFGITGALIFTILVFVSIIGAVASWIVTAPRLLMSMAEDNLFFSKFASIHPRNKSPHISIIFQFFITSILVILGAGSYEILLHMLIPMIIILYTAILLSVTILRIRKPELERPFVVPYGKYGPIVIVFFMLVLLALFIFEVDNSIKLLKVSLALISFGIPSYFFIEIFYNSKYVNIRKKIRAFFSHHYHSMPFPKKKFKTILKMLDVKRNSTKEYKILDYDCGVGSFTRELIKSGIPYSKIYAIDKSKEEIRIFSKKIPIHHKKKVYIIYRKDSKIPKFIDKVDLFFSFNSLNKASSVSKFIEEMKSVLKKDGEFCFYINHTLLNVNENLLLLEDYSRTLELFERHGLSISYVKKKSLFKEEIFIVGKNKKRSRKVKDLS